MPRFSQAGSGTFRKGCTVRLLVLLQAVQECLCLIHQHTHYNLHHHLKNILKEHLDLEFQFELPLLD